MDAHHVHVYQISTADRTFTFANTRVLGQHITNGGLKRRVLLRGGVWIGRSFSHEGRHVEAGASGVARD